MVYSRFRFQAIFRVAMLAATIAICLLILFKTEYRVTLVLGVFMCFYQIWALIHFVEKTERDTARFLSAIRHEDFFETFGSKRSPAARELHDAFARVMRDFRNVRAEREVQYLYLQTVVQHVGIGIMVFDREGQVDLVNSAALKLLQVLPPLSLKSLNNLSESVKISLMTMHPGETRTIKFEGNDGNVFLAVHATEFRREGKPFTLVSLQNIRQELEEKEMEAWQDIMRVLTHEIRNSITPIASLAGTVSEMMKSEEDEEFCIDEEDAADAFLAISTIEKRSKGLLTFVDSFRSLSHIPRPEFKIIPVQELFNHLETFFRNQFDTKEIEAEFSVEPASLEVTADHGQIEQVLINLILNAIQVMKNVKDPVIKVRCQINKRGRVIIEVEDNGPGLLEEVKEKIFIPFFTTKKEGSGIGLSLSRQIMRMHKGSITVNSVENEKTVFTLTF